MALQKPYRGLSNLVGLYEGGALQLELDRSIKLELDALEFAGDFRWQDTLILVNGAASFFLLAGPVPDGERWLISNIQLQSTGAMVATNSGLLSMFAADGITPRALTPLYVYIAGDFFACGENYAKPFVLESGEQIGFLSGRFPGANWPAVGSVRYAPVTF